MAIYRLRQCNVASDVAASSSRSDGRRNFAPYFSKCNFPSWAHLAVCLRARAFFFIMSEKAHSWLCGQVRRDALSLSLFWAMESAVVIFLQQPTSVRLPLRAYKDGEGPPQLGSLSRQYLFCHNEDKHVTLLDDPLLLGQAGIGERRSNQTPSSKLLFRCRLNCGTCFGPAGWRQQPRAFVVPTDIDRHREIKAFKW